MLIAVDIRGTREYQHFIFETFKRITPQHPAYTFLFIFDKPFDDAFNFSSNVVPVIATPRKVHLLQDRKTSSLLRKYKAAIFVTMRPVKTKVPQCLIAFDAVSERAIKRSKLVITDSEFSKKDMIVRLNITGDRVNLIYSGTDDSLKSPRPEERERIKEAHAGGNEYFFCFGNMSVTLLLDLLKAFSAFKKMQKTSMRLMIASEKSFPEGFDEKFRLFKYQDDVQIIPNIVKDELNEIMSAAYAFIYPGGGYYWPLQAMKCAVPLITANSGAVKEICDDAALYVDPASQKDLADAMSLLYKDERSRRQLIEKGQQLAEKYSWDVAAAALWKNIEKAVI